MPEGKTKIVLDADVIIHFAKGDKLSLLPEILPDFKFIVLDIVIRELPTLILSTLEKQMQQKHNIYKVVFGETSKERKEYLRLTSLNGPALGKGESACMVYCLYHNDVVGSSNTRDITDYCKKNEITFLTTNDFLFYAIKNGKMSKDEAIEFIRKVRSLGSFPEIVDFNTYICTKL